MKQLEAIKSLLSNSNLVKYFMLGNNSLCHKKFKISLAQGIQINSNFVHYAQELWQLLQTLFHRITFMVIQYHKQAL